MSISYDSEFGKLITGTISSLNGTVDLTSNNKGTDVVAISGTWSGTLVFEGSADGTTWYALYVLNNSSKLIVSSTTSNGSFVLSGNGFANIRVRSSLWTSGTVTINSTGMDAASFVTSDSSLRGGTDGTAIGNVGPALKTILRDASDVALGTSTNPLYINGQSEILSPLPGFVARSNKVLTAGATQQDVYTMTQDIALVDFHFGGRGIGQAAIYRIDDSAIEFVPGGGFNSSANVSLWTNAGIGSSSGLVWAYSTAQAFEGTGSAAVTFTQSDSNNYPAIKYTFSTPKDVSAWHEISAHVRVTVAAGGAQTRSAQIILTDSNGSTRLYALTGTTNTAPFSTEQWLQVLGIISSPTSETGTFDPYNVVSITLKLLDGGNKAGTIYWDNVRFLHSQEVIERIYIDANRTFQLILNPVELFDTGEVLAIEYKNNDATSKEFTVTAKGVVRT